MLIEDDLMYITSALWLYMTPFPPAPSIHDVVVGNFEPSEADMYYGMYPYFNITHLIRNGTEECNTNPFYTDTLHPRVSNYLYFLDQFYLMLEDEYSLFCYFENFTEFFSNGTADIMAFWRPSADEFRCELTKDKTEFNIFTKNDYKRCVCHHYGNGEDDCTEDDSDQDTDDSDNENNGEGGEGDQDDEDDEDTSEETGGGTDDREDSDDD